MSTFVLFSGLYSFICGNSRQVTKGCCPPKQLFFLNSPLLNLQIRLDTYVDLLFVHKVTDQPADQHKADCEYMGA